MHSENAQVHTVISYCSGGEHSVKCVCRHWKWRKAKKSREMWFVSWWLRVLERAKFIVACLLCMANTVCPWQVCTSGKRDSTKDTHHCKTIRIQDRPIEPLCLMWLRGLMIWSGKTDESQRNKFVFRLALAMAPCMPLSKITCSLEKFVHCGFCINWRGDKWLTKWLHVICSGTTRKNMFLSRIVTGDETWCLNFEPESKWQSQQRKHLNFPLLKKSSTVHMRTYKVVMTFFDCRGPLLIKFLECGVTINAKHYADTFQKLWCTIKSKRPGMLLYGIVLLHDNSCPHTADSMRDKLQRFGW